MVYVPMLDELELDDIPLPGVLPDGVYPGFVYECGFKSSKDGKKFLVFTYKVAEPHPLAGATKDEWKSANKSDDAKMKSWLKQRIVSLGVPEDRIKDTNPSDLVGTAIYFTIKNKDGFCNVNNVTLNTDDEFAGSNAGSPDNPAKTGTLDF